VAEVGGDVHASLRVCCWLVVGSVEAGRGCLQWEFCKGGREEKG
jgi:hypothetical protein